MAFRARICFSLLRGIIRDISTPLKSATRPYSRRAPPTAGSCRNGCGIVGRSGLGTIDVFIHDSLHTYDHMLWEYRAAYDHIRPGGLLISDDALWNSAFSEFAATVGARHAQILRGVGVLRKEIP